MRSAALLICLYASLPATGAEAPPWSPIFDGRSFAGWEGNLHAFRIEDGAIVGGRLDQAVPRNEYLCTTTTYRDFELRLKFRLRGEDVNAGVQFRSQRVPGSNEMIGYQADMGQHYWGCLYDERRHKLLAGPTPAEQQQLIRHDDWNDYAIRAEGRHVQLWLNGHKTVDYTEPDATIPQEGVFGLQIHQGPASEAWYKDITIQVLPEPASAPRDLSGWRGGIGITFGTPSRDIADVTEMGYEIVWGGENPRAVKALGISVFRYWNSIVETSLKGPGYDFSGLPDKQAAAQLAFDAWMERTYGVPGLSKYANVRYHPEGAYGDVYGSMDLSSENELVRAVIDRYMQGFEKDGIVHGGIGLDNAGKVPREFLEALSRRLNARGLGIAANGCPDEYLTYIDFFGNEGFPFSIDYARRAREKGLRGILGEFTMQHLSGGELDAYLRSKLFNGIVFFGYTNGGTAAGARYSGYCSRPDVYHHQRWVLRKLVPVSRAVQRAGRQVDPAAQLSSAAAPAGPAGAAPAGVTVDADGKVKEVKRGEAGLERITGRSPATTPVIARYGRDVAQGVYLFVDSGQPEEVVCDARKLGVDADTLVFDEFAGRVLEASRTADQLTFKTLEGPSVVQLANAPTVAKSLLARTAEGLRLQLAQRALDRELGTRLPRKVWSRFCQGGKWDAGVARSGQGSLAVVGGTYTGTMPRWKYFNRQGAAQLVWLNQDAPQSIVLRAFSKARDVIASEEVVLDTPAARRHHFDAREGHAYCMHLYLDYQDGQWPEVHTVRFSAGTHDWEEKSIRVEPARRVQTAMVLLEFHQPQGGAWFDDLSLSSGNGKENLLAAPGFEDDDPGAVQSQAISAAYEEQVQTLLTSLQAAVNSAAPGQTLPALERQVDTLAASVRGKGLAAWFSRELRDLDDALDKLRLCMRLLAVGG